MILALIFENVADYWHDTFLGDMRYLLFDCILARNGFKKCNFYFILEDNYNLCNIVLSYLNCVLIRPCDIDSKMLNMRLKKYI